MEKINNWDEIEAKGMDDFKSLEAGAYKCKIMKAEEYTNTQTGNKSLKVMVDIVDGKFKDYFTERYKNDTREDKKWDNNACKYLGLADTGLPFLKGFITCVENSNNGYKWDWDETKLKGKAIGCVFRYEEYEKQDGTKGIKTKLAQFRSVDKLSEVDQEKLYSVKLLNGKYMSIDDYYENKDDGTTPGDPFNELGDVVEITNDILD